ncbi:MAG TPA: hypothetical protein VNN10_05645 [Dehalococcoidia bacterium]|nr:hypothetical protein [Dehalococcoidia bacterium]
MPFSHFNLYGKPWDAAADLLERTIRIRMQDEEEPAPELSEAEISEAERRAAIARERMRRLGIR